MKIKKIIKKLTKGAIVDEITSKRVSLTCPKTKNYLQIGIVKGSDIICLSAHDITSGNYIEIYFDSSTKKRIIQEVLATENAVLFNGYLLEGVDEISFNVYKILRF